MLDGSEPALGSVSPKQPIASPPASSGSQRSFCSSEPNAWIAFIASEPCTDTNVPQPAVDGLELGAGQPVLDGAAARAAVALQMHPQRPEIAELAHQRPIPLAALVQLGDARRDALGGPRRDPLADGELLRREVVVQVEEVERVQLTPTRSSRGLRRDVEHTRLTSRSSLIMREAICSSRS